MDPRQLKPTLLATQMKRSQEDVLEKNVIALFDQRRQLKDAIEQNWDDLLFIGYNPPDESPSEKKMTQNEFTDMFEKDGFGLYRKDAIKEVYERVESDSKTIKNAFAKCHNLTKERLLLQNEVKALKKLLRGRPVTGSGKKK